MPQYFCHQCAITLGIPASAQTEKLLDSQYQLDKFVKHTAPGTAYQLNSIFADPGTAAYAHYVVNTAGSGWVEVDQRSRYNMTWYAGEVTGAEYRNGTFALPTRSIKLVCYYDSYKIHAFPYASNTLKAISCSRCGNLVPYE